MIKLSQRADAKFWLYYPSGKLIKWTDYNIEHDDKISAIDPREDKNLIRGNSVFNELNIEAVDENMVTWALRRLPQKYLFKKYLIVDTFTHHVGTIEIEENEDALDAWNRRRGIRKRK